MEITIAKLTSADEEILSELLHIYAESFDLPGFKMPSAPYLKRLLAHPAMIIMVAIRSGKVIGGLTAYLLPGVYHLSDELYLYDLAVSPAFHRQGLGTLLLQELRAYGARVGASELFVQADRPDQYAFDFYTKNGGLPKDVIHFSFRCSQGSR